MSFDFKKTGAKKSASPKKRRTSRKPKVSLDKTSLILLTGIIALCGIILLALCILLNNPSKEKTESKEKVSIEKQMESSSSKKEKKSGGEKKKSDEKKSVKENNADSGTRKNKPEKEKTSSENKNSAAVKNPETEKNDSVQNETSIVTGKNNQKADLKNQEKENKASGEQKKNDAVKDSAKNNGNEVNNGNNGNSAPDDSLNQEKNNPVQNASDQDAKKKAGNEKNISEKQNASVTQVPQSMAEKYKIPEAVNHAVLCFVFDDAGQNVEKLKKYTSLRMPLAVAVLPKLSHSAECAEVIRNSKKELLLHQPMQAGNLKINPGKGAVLPDMNTFEIARTIKENLQEVGPVAGMNNHEGSLISEDEIKIGAVLDVACESGIYFLDSRTTAATKAPQAALERDMKILERDVFLDDIVSREEILNQVYRALGIANKKGKAIIIGHVDKSADIIPVLLTEMYPLLVEKGYRICMPSELMK